MNICAFSKDHMSPYILTPRRHDFNRPDTVRAVLFFRRFTMRERLYDWLCDNGAAALAWTALLLLVPMLLTGGM